MFNSIGKRLRYNLLWEWTFSNGVIFGTGAKKIGGVKKIFFFIFDDVLYSPTTVPKIEKIRGGHVKNGRFLCTLDTECPLFTVIEYIYRDWQCGLRVPLPEAQCSPPTALELVAISPISLTNYIFENEVVKRNFEKSFSRGMS